MSFYDPGNPYTFTWGTSTWGSAGAVWSTPGVYAESATIPAATSTALASEEVLIETSGTVSAVSASEGASSTTVYVNALGTGIYTTETTQRLYLRLPDCYRDADTTAPGQGSSGTPTQFPLLRWLAALVDQAGEIETLINRFSSDTSSDLTDPATADATWLPWLAQLVGLAFTNPIADVPDARTTIANAIVGTPRGSKGSIIAAVKPLLTGTQTVTVSDHYGGDPWAIQVATLTAETPPTLPGEQWLKWGTSEWGTATAVWADPDPIVWYLETKGLLPAGFKFVHTTS